MRGKVTAGQMAGKQLRELSTQQHRLTSALARQAGRLTAQAGQRIGDDVRQEVQDTLHAVLADPEGAAQWAKGRLTRPLSVPAGFPTPFRQPAQAPAPRRATRPADEVRQLQDAERDQQRARDAVRKARDHTRDADRAVREARRRAKDAAAHARKLAEQTQHRCRFSAPTTKVGPLTCSFSTSEAQWPAAVSQGHGTSPRPERERDFPAAVGT